MPARVLEVQIVREKREQPALCLRRHLLFVMPSETHLHLRPARVHHHDRDARAWAAQRSGCDVHLLRHAHAHGAAKAAYSKPARGNRTWPSFAHMQEHGNAFGNAVREGGRAAVAAAEAARATAESMVHADYKELNTTSLLYKYAILILVVYLMVGSTFFHFAEDWDWVESCYFCCVCLSTVGYGDLLPKSGGAKAFTSLYVLFGLSLVATSLGAMLGALANRLQKGLGKVEGRLARRNVHLQQLGGAFVGLFLLAFVGATVVHFTERWSWGDSFYFALVTCMSVGFGDFTPAHTSTRVFLIFYLLFAVGWFATALGRIAGALMDVERDRAIAKFIARGVSPQLIRDSGQRGTRTCDSRTARNPLPARLRPTVDSGPRRQRRSRQARVPPAHARPDGQGRGTGHRGDHGPLRHARRGRQRHDRPRRCRRRDGAAPRQPPGVGYRRPLPAWRFQGVDAVGRSGRPALSWRQQQRGARAPKRRSERAAYCDRRGAPLAPDAGGLVGRQCLGRRRRAGQE